MWIKGAWESLYLAGFFEGQRVPWACVLNRPPGMGMHDACGCWHGFEAANDD